MSILSEKCLELVKMYHAGNYEGCLSFIRNQLTPEILKNVTLESMSDADNEISDQPMDEIFPRRFGKDKVSEIWDIIANSTAPEMSEEDDEEDSIELEDLFPEILCSESSPTSTIDLNELLENGHTININITPKSIVLSD